MDGVVWDMAHHPVNDHLDQERGLCRSHGACASCVILATLV